MTEYDPNKIPIEFHCRRCKTRCFTEKNGKRWCKKCNDYA